MIALLIILALSACNPVKRVDRVAIRTDTQVTKVYTAVASDGFRCQFKRPASDTLRLVRGDSLRCRWSDTP